MKKVSLGIIIGLLIGLLTASTIAVADSPIKLIINGNTIACDVAPQVLNGRTMVPARYVAESLGATVSWDAGQNAVVINSAVQIGGTPTDLNSTKTTSEATNNASETEWIKNTDLVRLYGCAINTNNNKFYISKGDKQVTFDAPAGDYSNMGIYQALPNLQVMFSQGRLLYNKSEIFQLLGI